MTQERFFELVYAWKDGDLTGDELYQRVFVLSNVVGQSDQLDCEMCGGRIDKEDKFTDEKHCENCGWF